MSPIFLGGHVWVSQSSPLRESFPNILIPQFRPGSDEIAHELDARRVLEHFHLHALRADVFLRTLKRFVFPDDKARDFVEQNCAAAHRTGRKRRIQNTALINRRLEPPGVFEAVHFRVVYHAAALHPLVMAAPDDFAVEHEHRTDGDAAFGQAGSGFFNRRLKKNIHARIGTFPLSNDKCWWGERPREPNFGTAPTRRRFEKQ